MSIFAYVGLPGSGKSYSVVANQIVPGLKDDRVVVTNLPVYEDRIREVTELGELREFPIDKIALEPGLIDEYAPPGCVLVIDELWKLFPAGQKVNQVPEPFKSYLAEHRHKVDARGRSTQIVFVTQDLAQIGMFARQLVEQTFVHMQLGHLGLKGSYQCKVYHRAVSGPTPPESRLINKMHGRYEERIYRLYKSHTQSEASTDGAMEKAVDTRGNVWKRPGVIASGLLCVALIWWGSATLADIFAPDPPPAPARASVATARPARPSSQPQSSPAPGAALRLSAVIAGRNPGEGYAMLQNDRGEVTWISDKDCVYARLQWRCQVERQWITLQGTGQPMVLERESRGMKVPGLE